MNINNLSKKFSVKELNIDDAKDIYDLQIENPMYFEFCPPAASIDSIIEDMKVLPPNTTYEDKFYIGFFDDNILIAVMDLILHYPNKETAFIGFL